MPDLQSLIEELDAALLAAPPAQCAMILRRVTELFVERAGTYSGDQVAVFDAVLLRLIDKADRAGLAALSARLAPFANAPVTVVDRLAGHEDPAIAGPVLRQCEAVSERILAAVAAQKSEKHLVALGARTAIGETVTEPLVERCSVDLACKIIGNPEAKLSELGFVKLISRAKSDRSLAAAIAARPDLPPELKPFLQLTLG